MDALQDRTGPCCEACDDSGWRAKSCDGTHTVICGRRRAHLPHNFVVPCECRPMNRVYQDRVANSRRVA